jgi:hypothetical protein
VISLELGSKLQAGDIKEGDDVYFECRIDANPKFRRLTWLHNVSLFLKMFIEFLKEFQIVCNWHERH